MNKATLTRRVYRFEGQVLRKDKALWMDTPMRALRRLALRVAMDHNRSAPVVAAGRGLGSRRRLSSWSNGKVIVLARHHRNPVVLLHEMAHYLSGRGLDHGPAFVRRYFGLLTRYLGVDDGRLVLSAGLMGVAGCERSA